MCGICGFIGKSKNYNQTYNIITELLSNSEVRGEDATGFWATESGKEGSIIHHKEPIKASEFIKLKAWMDLKNMDLNMMVAHARGASTGVGSPVINKNNHPFVSDCQTVALVHNGRVPDSDYRSLRKQYEVETDCDSEILLRIFEGSDHLKENIDDLLPLVSEDIDEVTKKRLIGLKDVWSFANHTQMAVAIGERLKSNHRRLWLFRNEFRSLWLFDMRKELGQIFFCSTPEIWQDAFQNSKMNKTFKKISINELPTEEIWSLEINEENEVVGKNNINKYLVSSKNTKEFEVSAEIIPIVKKPKYPKVITLPEETKPITVPAHNQVNMCFPDNKTKMGLLPHIQQKVLGSPPYDPDKWTPTVQDYDIDEEDTEIFKVNTMCDNIIKLTEQFNNNFNFKADKMLQYKIKTLALQLADIEKELESVNDKL